ncbi:hypothetical protein VTG60DRAFT_4266 [Thermothelomyces hinnuleus]
MISRSVLLSLAGVASANFLQLRAPQASYDPQCLSALSELQTLATAIPTTTDPVIASWNSELATATITDICQITVPPDVQSAYSSIADKYSSIVEENKDAFSAASKYCADLMPDLSDVTASLASLPKCTNAAGSSGSDSDDDNDNDNDSEGSSSGDKDNAASRPTGLLGMAVALAGFLGVVAVL